MCELNALHCRSGGGVRISLVHYELYNDTVRDLIEAAARGAPELLRGGGGALRATRDEALGVSLSAAPVARAADALALVRASCALRATAATGCNDRSSRSHSVLRIAIERSGGGGARGGARGGGGGGGATSALYMVDLAGSERMQESGASGARVAVRGAGQPAAAAAGQRRVHARERAPQFHVLPPSRRRRAS